MTDIDLSDRALAELDLGRIAVPGPQRNAGPWELWICFAAAASVMFVIAIGLLILTAELRAGWVPGHELPMDKATAIHKLLFRS